MQLLYMVVIIMMVMVIVIVMVMMMVMVMVMVVRVVVVNGRVCCGDGRYGDGYCYGDGCRSGHLLTI